jgi:hypothetical protein
LLGVDAAQFTVTHSVTALTKGVAMSPIINPKTVVYAADGSVGRFSDGAPMVFEQGSRIFGITVADWVRLAGAGTLDDFNVMPEWNHIQPHYRYTGLIINVNMIYRCVAGEGKREVEEERVWARFCGTATQAYHFLSASSGSR